MPLVNTKIGPLPIPAPAGAPQAPLVEESSLRLSDYLTFWLRWGLDDKLATMTAPKVGGAVKATYLNQPDAMMLSRALPALFCWWNGASKFIEYSSVEWYRQRDFSILYVFERVTNVASLNVWTGLISTADALLMRAIDRRSHPEYTYAGSGKSAGTDIRFMNDWKAIDYLGGTPGFLKELPVESIRKLSSAAGRQGTQAAQGGIQAGYPTLSATVRIWESIGQDTMIDPTDVTHDILTSISGGEGAAEPFPDLLERILPEPDGSAEDQDA